MNGSKISYIVFGFLNIDVKIKTAEYYNLSFSNFFSSWIIYFWKAFYIWNFSSWLPTTFTKFANGKDDSSCMKPQITTFMDFLLKTSIDRKNSLINILHKCFSRQLFSCSADQKDFQNKWQKEEIDAHITSSYCKWLSVY